MSCNKESCKCAFSTMQLWASVYLPDKLVHNFEQLTIYHNGVLLTPSHAFGKKGAGDYDLLDGFLVFQFKVHEGNVVNIVWENSRWVYLRKEDGWKLEAVL